MNSTKNKQRGASFISILFVGGVLGLVLVVGLQVVPTYVEYRTIGVAVGKVKGASTPAEARISFDRAAVIDDIKSITGKDLVIKQVGTKTVVSFAYTTEIHLAGPAYLLMKYAGSSN